MREETLSSWVKFLALPLFGTLLTGCSRGFKISEKFGKTMFVFTPS
jgi:hypothetical protein